jgi:sugar O-acyltransferase (sialic acid O-acetyltransferase NeuD family)
MWQQVVPARQRVVMYGAADQARVNRPILEDLGCEIVALVDDTPRLCSPFPGVPLLFGWNGFATWLRNEDPSALGFVIAIGQPYGHVRCSLHDRMVEAGVIPISFADRTALISASAILGDGLQVMPQALVHPEARIGRQCILNTRALVEHDCVLDDGVEIAPGAVLTGRVHVGAYSWIGAGATIRPRIRIGKNTIVGAGAVVVTDIPDDVVAVGVPAKPQKRRVACD